MISFGRLEALSFAHSAIYCGLLTAWLSGDESSVKTALGWGHGVGWILMSALCLHAVRRRIIPLWLGAMVIVVGGVGPFAGTIGFVHEDRRRRTRSRGIV